MRGRRPGQQTGSGGRGEDGEGRAEGKKTGSPTTKAKRGGADQGPAQAVTAKTASEWRSWDRRGRGSQS